MRNYLSKLGATEDSTVLDPFCGTGTTLVECKKLGIRSVGIEAHPMPHFAAKVKLDWSVAPEGLLSHARKVTKTAISVLEKAGLDDSGKLLILKRQAKKLIGLPEDAAQLLLANSISPLPLHKTLVLLDAIKTHLDPRYCQYELLAIAKAVVSSISNLHFGPEVGVQKPKVDVAVFSAWMQQIENMAADISTLQPNESVPAQVFLGDARAATTKYLRPDSIDFVITSPPYPNEKDYTRTTRLESVLLNFVTNRSELKALKKTLVRSNTRNVYKQDDDDKWVADHEEIQRIASAIEKRRIELRKTSGFERLYAKVTKLYFGGMMQHLKQLTEVLRPGARLAYVVGDQASYLRVMIRTGKILAEIADQLGYEVLSIDLFRTRLATATKEQLREEVIVLRWPGKVIGTRSLIHESSIPRRKS